jgi:hypothetical protein
MKIRIFVACVATILSCMVSETDASQARHAIGMDIIRLVDKNQDGGMANVHGQIGLTRDSALALGYAKGDDSMILDFAFKYYFGAYFNGASLQFGIGYYDHDRHGDDFGFVLGLGYEKHLNDFLALSWTMRMVAQVDEPIIGYRETPVFQPAMSIMITF